MHSPFYNFQRGAGTVSGPVIVTPAPWPKILLPLKLLAQPGDRGLGDIIERVIGPIGGEAFKAWHLKVFGRPCGCAARRDAWNAKYHL